MKERMNIIQVDPPETKDIDFLTQQINQETPEYGNAYPFSFFIKDDQNQIIAGANGSVVFGAIYTDQLWVHSAYRGQGLGKKLMDHIHHYGRQRHCTMATITTMSFQNTQKFYEKLGYTCDFERFGHVKNSSYIFLRKDL